MTRSILPGLAVLLAVGGYAQDWQAKDQPDLAAALAAAAPLTATAQPSPTKTTRVSGTYQVPNPDGQSVDIVQIYFPHYGGPDAFLLIDTATGALQQVVTDSKVDGSVNVHLAPGVVTPDNKLYINWIGGPKYSHQLIRYDPATNEFKLKALALPETIHGETHPMVLSTDGKLVMAGGHAGQVVSAVVVDPVTNDVRDYGPLGPSHAPEGAWGYSVAADDTHIYIASGKVPWYLLAVDRASGKCETLYTTKSVGGMVSVMQRYDGVTFLANNLADTGENVAGYLYQGKAYPRKAATDPPPWPAKAAPAKPLTYEVSLAEAEVDNDGKAALWYRAPAAKAAAPKDAPKDEVSDRTGWKQVAYQVPTYSMDPFRLVELPDGRLFGSAGEYQGNFMVDPQTGKAWHLGKATDLSHYATTLLDGKIYMSGYPSSPLYVYDPSQPWTASTLVNGRRVAEAAPESNPRKLRLMGDKKLAGTHKMYAAVSGADGKVYFGGRWVRDGDCGGVCWYDPKTGEYGGLWQPLSNYPISHMTTVGNGRYVVISTYGETDSVLNKPRPESGALFTIDTTTMQLSEPFAPVVKARGTGLVLGVGENRVIGWTEDPANPAGSLLYGCDPVARRTLWTKALPWKVPVSVGSNQKEGFDFRLGPDGQIWTFMGGAMVRIDPADATIRPVGKIGGGRIAFSGKDVWLTGGGLRKVAGIVP